MIRRVAFGIPVVAALLALDYWLWVGSNGIDCYPACSSYQDSLRWLGWLLAVLVAVLAGTSSYSPSAQRFVDGRAAVGPDA